MIMELKNRINFNGYYYMSYDDREKFYGKKDYSTWCRNYTFMPREVQGKIYMVDTYWGCNFNNDLAIEVTDENINYFELKVDVTKVTSIKENERQQYGWENVVTVITGGTGSDRVTHFVPNELKKSVEYTIEQINEKIDDLNRQLQNALDLKRQIAETGEVPKYFYI